MTNECPPEIVMNGTKYVREDTIATTITGPKGPLVLIRSKDSGVHIGELVSRDGTEVVLANSRRLWRWKGAFTLSEVACNGVESGSRISQPVSSMTVLGVCEIIPVTQRASNSLTTSTG